MTRRSNSNNISQISVLLRLPIFWISGLMVMVVASGFIISVNPFVSYVDIFPFNRNYKQAGSGKVFKCEGPISSARHDSYYIISFIWLHNDCHNKTHVSQCIFFTSSKSITSKFMLENKVSVLAYKNNPYISKLNGCCVSTIHPTHFYFSFAVSFVVCVVYFTFIRVLVIYSRPQKRKK